MLAELDPQDTIAAIATAAGHGLRGIVRLSGPYAWSIALAGFQADDNGPLPRHAEMRRGTLRLPSLRPLLPVRIRCWPAPGPTPVSRSPRFTRSVRPRSWTSCSPTVCGAACDTRSRANLPCVRSVRRIDLTRAEAVLGVIDAHNSTQLDAALRQLAGGISGPLLVIRDRLLDLVAHLEANLDFVDEADVDPLGRRS